MAHWTYGNDEQARRAARIFPSNKPRLARFTGIRYRLEQMAKFQAWSVTFEHKDSNVSNFFECIEKNVASVSAMLHSHPQYVSFSATARKRRFKNLTHLLT